MWTTPPAQVALNHQGAEITWTPSHAKDIAGYEVHISRNWEGPYTKLTRELLTGTRYVTPELRYGKYYFVIFAVDNKGNRSLNSAVAEVTIW